MSKVLIADDDINIISSCTNFLTNEKNIEIIDVVNNGKDAVTSYKRNKPDVMVLDLKMPNMGGLEVINELSTETEEKKKNNIIVISGSLSELQPYNTAKVYKIIPKPFKMNELIDTINEIQENIDYEYLEKNIDDLFKKLRLPFLSAKGINYLKQAVIFCYYDETLFYNISEVYEMVAKYYISRNVKPKSVMWSLESIINTYRKGLNHEYLKNTLVYYDETKSMTPKYLIELIVIHLRETIK